MYRDSIFWVEVERIKPNPFQPRREFDQAKLEELADSIRMYGLLQPLTVTRKETNLPDGGIQVEYELIAGERRLRASKLAGIQQLPVIIRSGEDDDQVKLELAIIENLQREDLNPVDRARAFEKLAKDFGFSHAQIGKKMGKSREYVSNTLRLLSLPEAMLNYLAEGRISEGHTRPLLMLSKKPEEQEVLMKEILLKKLTVRETEQIARRVAQDRVHAQHKIDPEILSVERALTERLGTRVTIEPREVGGRLVISFFSAEDLQTLLDSMKVADERAQLGAAFNGVPVAVEEVVEVPASSQDEPEQHASEREVSPVDQEVVAAIAESTPTQAVEQQNSAEGRMASGDREVFGTIEEVTYAEGALAATPGQSVEETHTAPVPEPKQAQEQASQHVPYVEPSPAFPQPEPAQETEPRRVDEPASGEGTLVGDAATGGSETSSEQEDDLYSIRNFSI